MHMEGNAVEVAQIKRRKRKQMSQNGTSFQRVENNMFLPDCLNPLFLYFSKE